jgi:transcriptional regulator with XRE-family HTH domain
MPAFQDPAALRRRLQKDLRTYRSEAQMTQRDVALAMDWSPSKLIRIESGTVAVSTNDLRALLAHYGVTDPAVVEGLVSTAKGAKKSSWTEYRDVVSLASATYFGYEASASIIRQYEPLLVPGLLQTEEYMRAVFADVLVPPPANVERLVQARQERQELLDRDVLPEMFFILDEAALHRQMGGAGTMRRQLQRLEELSSRDRISIQVMPFSRGAYGGLFGPFILLEFPGVSDDMVLYLESRNDTVTRDDADETGRYLDLFWKMENQLATAPDRLPSVISKINAGWEAEAHLI